MCGICGIIGVSDKGEGAQNFAFEQAIPLMNAALAHRGPDDEGSYFDNGIALGHRRLSIIDLSKNGHQPMFSADGNLVLTYNGELYNYKELKLELQRAKVDDTVPAYPFRTQSDSEVILAAYQRWGVECLKYFDGMFALAIWDKQKESLFVARDRLGIKPLYYWQGNDKIVFASELRALLQSNIVPRRLEKNAVCDYVSFQTVHAPATIIENVKMLLPGHYLHIRKKEVKIPVSQYQYWGMSKWKVFKQDAPAPSPERTYAEICKDVRDLFFASVEKRLVSDVPFGAFLSGGIDSSLVVAVMSKLMREKVRTFSVTFDEAEYSEASYSEQIAKEYNTEHLAIKLTPADCLQKLPDALSAMDHPSGDGINTYIVSEATRQAGITMALSGLGSDELFAGYPLFKRLYKLEKLKWLRGFPFVSTPFKVLNAVRPSPSSAKLLEISKLPGWELQNTYSIIRESFTQKEMKQLLYSCAPLERKLFFSSRHEILSKISIAELSNYLPDILLRDTDQMSMAHALEVRVPFLDYTLVEYVLDLSDSVKYPKTPKKLLTDAMQGLLPDNIIHRKKMGFTFPWGSWMKNELKSFCGENITGLSRREYFNKNNVQSLWDNFLKGNPQTPYYKIWHLAVLENWIKENNIDA